LDAVRGREIAMIFQDIMYSLNPVFTIGMQLTEVIRRHLKYDRRKADALAASLLERTGLPQAAMRKFPHQLSGGQRQRAMIAMALACRPRLLIADEPTTALDVTIQLQIMQLLKALRDETGMAILLITHDLGLVAEMADRVVVMYAGQCVETCDTRRLLAAPAHPYTRALLQSVPGLDDARGRRLLSIPGAVPERYQDMTGCRFAPRCPYSAICGGEAHVFEPEPGRSVRCCEAVAGEAGA
ncbi:MAG: ABC transporter ATP-binding protein, partial [Clostridia bacterium]|nr:ABC transporter ATP-binding protein [Clostridia bacterium]